MQKRILRDPEPRTIKHSDMKIAGIWQVSYFGDIYLILHHVFVQPIYPSFLLVLSGAEEHYHTDRILHILTKYFTNFSGKVNGTLATCYL